MVSKFMRFAALAIVLAGPAMSTAGDWGALDFLVGQWTAEGGGSPGQGSGGFSFEPDLQRRILIRKSHTDYPAAKERPAFAHDDLMIIFRDPDERAEGAVRAIYFDNEGHVIHYLVTMFGDRVIFTSDPAEHGPHFRLSYERMNGNALRIKFEISAPGKGFAPYVEGTAKRILGK